jgi:hypothetical protein
MEARALRTSTDELENRERQREKAFKKRRKHVRVVPPGLFNNA